jgi:hypothetical protein
MAHASAGNDAAANGSMSTARELAVPESYVRVFADEGEALAHLLHGTVHS